MLTLFIVAINNNNNNFMLVTIHMNKVIRVCDLFFTQGNVHPKRANLFVNAT